MPLQVSVVLPTFNERENIGELVSEILDRLPAGSEVIVVDDDSPDGTGRIVEEIAERDGRVRLLRRIGARGLTSALRDGIAAARNRWVVWMDADFAHPPSLLPEIISQPEEFEVVVASRYAPGGRDGRPSPLRRGVSVLLNRFGRAIAHCRVRDLSSGYLRVEKSVFKRIPLRGEYGDYCIDFLVRAEHAGCRIREIPFTNVDRTKGSSKTTHNPLIFLRFALIYVKTLIRLRKELPALKAKKDDSSSCPGADGMRS